MAARSCCNPASPMPSKTDLMAEVGSPVLESSASTDSALLPSTPLPRSQSREVPEAEELKHPTLLLHCPSGSTTIVPHCGLKIEAFGRHVHGLCRLAILKQALILTHRDKNHFLLFCCCVSNSFFLEIGPRRFDCFATSFPCGPAVDAIKLACDDSEHACTSERGCDRGS